MINYVAFPLPVAANVINLGRNEVVTQQTVFRIWKCTFHTTMSSDNRQWIEMQPRGLHSKCAEHKMGISLKSEST